MNLFIQRHWTHQINDYDHLNYPSRLEALNLYSMKDKLLRDDVMSAGEYFLMNVKYLQDIFTLELDRGISGHISEQPWNVQDFFPEVCLITAMPFLITLLQLTVWKPSSLVCAVLLPTLCKNFKTIC